MNENENKVNTSSKTEEESKEEEKKEPYSINIAEYERIDEDIRTVILSSKTLAEKIAAIFGEAFPDYYGCKILINPDKNSPLMNYGIYLGTPYVDLYFRYNNESNVENAIDRRNNVRSDGDYGEGLVNIIGNHSVNAYVLTEKAKEILSKFIIPTNGNKAINWEFLTRENQEGMNPNNIYARETVVTVSGITLQTIVEFIYGRYDTPEQAKLDEKHQKTIYDYAIQVAKSLPARYSNMGLQNQEYLFTINQLNRKAIYKLQKELGLISAMR